MVTFWVSMPIFAKLLLLGILAVFLTSAIRIGRLIHSLNRDSRISISYESIVQGTVKPETVAVYALRGRFGDEVKEFRSQPQAGMEIDPKRVTSLLRSAKTRFLYLWENYNDNATSIRRASVTAILLTALLVIVPCFRCCSRLTDFLASTCLISCWKQASISSKQSP